MKLRELKEMVERDSIIDPSELNTASLDSARLQGKYFNLHVDERARLQGLEMKYERVLQEKFEYYKGVAPPEVYKEKPFGQNLTNGKAQSYAECDPEVEEIKAEITIQKLKLDLIADMKQSLNWRHSQIKNAIEFLKWQSGG